jgi:hypothetical protein
MIGISGCSLLRTDDNRNEDIVFFTIHCINNNDIFALFRITI